MFHLSHRVLSRTNRFRRAAVPHTPSSAALSSIDQSTTATPPSTSTATATADPSNTDETQDPQVFMDTVGETFEQHERAIAQLLSSKHKPFAVIDNFFPHTTIQALRNEAVRLRDNGNFVTSQSERNGVTYEKHNVEAMQLDGGDQYFDAPRLHEYVVQAARSLPSLLSNGDVELDGTFAANKLAVCLGDGASYDKHLDNSGNGDTRKLTALLYLNQPTWEPSLGGEFRLWYDDEKGEENIVDVAPVGGRLIVFFSDSLVHAVMPTGVRTSEDHRYALTVWLPTAKGVSDIEEDRAKEEKHWGNGSTLANEENGENIVKIW